MKIGSWIASLIILFPVCFNYASFPVGVKQLFWSHWFKACKIYTEDCVLEALQRSRGAVALLSEDRSVPIIPAPIWERTHALTPVALEAVGPCSSTSHCSHGNQAPVQVAQGLLGATRTAPHCVCDVPCKPMAKPCPEGKCYEWGL